MHRIIGPDGVERQSAVVWWTAALSYLAFITCGVLFIGSPELSDRYGYFGDLMALFLVIGGGSSCFGSVTRNWMGEFIGTPMLAVAFSVLGLLTWKSSHANYPWLAYGNLILLCGLALLMIIRFRQLVALYHFIHESNKEVRRD